MTDKMTMIARAQTRLINAEGELRAAQKMLEEAKQANDYPPEPQSDYIAFTVTFSIPGQGYRYAAVRHAGRWYTTGGERFDSWEKLVDWIRRNDVRSLTYVIELSGRGGIPSIPIR